jgi:4a-hydroxytetrahydrobiopterin dehydratase
MKAENTDNRALSRQDVEARLTTDLPKWQFRDGFLRRKYRTGGWKGTLMAINAIGHLAEAAWHHPDIHASYATVEVSLQTHDAGGITGKDFELAKKIEEVVMWQPGKASGALSGTPADPRHAYIEYD